MEPSSSHASNFNSVVGPSTSFPFVCETFSTVLGTVHGGNDAVLSLSAAATNLDALFSGSEVWNEGGHVDGGSSVLLRLEKLLKVSVNL